LGNTGGHIGDKDMGIFGNIAPQPGFGMAMHGIGHHNHEPVFLLLDHGDIGFQQTVLVEPLRIGNYSAFAIDPVGRDVIEHLPGITSLYQKL